MGDISKNISRHELECNCGCGFNTADYMLVNALQGAVYALSVRYQTRIILKINSGCRCLSYNREIGSNDTSQHTLARACDHEMYLADTGAKIDPNEVADYYAQRYPSQFGIGRYKTFTHLDTRDGKKARW